MKYRYNDKEFQSSLDDFARRIMRLKEGTEKKKEIVENVAEGIITETPEEVENWESI